MEDIKKRLKKLWEQVPEGKVVMTKGGKKYWAADGQNYGTDTDTIHQPGGVMKMVEKKLEIDERVVAMLREGVKDSVIVMVVSLLEEPSWPPVWRILKYYEYGRLCWKHGLKPGMFTEITYL